MRLASKHGIWIAVCSLQLAACDGPQRSPVAPITHDSARLGDLVQHYRRVGKGPPLLLIHGLTNTWRVWRPHIESLAATHELIIPDLRGHGDTPNPAATLTQMQVARDLLALLDTLGFRQVQIAGFSFGGMVALRMAALQPERVEAMIVIAGAHRLLGSARTTHEANARSDIPRGWYLDTVRTWHPGGEPQVQRVSRQGITAALADDFAMSDSSVAGIRKKASKAPAPRISNLIFQRDAREACASVASRLINARTK